MASSVTLSSPSVYPTHSVTAPQTAPSVLDRCVENLSPDKVASFEKKVNHWNIISVVSTVAFFALAIGAFVAAGILAPVYMPVAGISIILLAIPTVQQIMKFREWAETARVEVDKYKAIQQRYADLTGQTPQQLQGILLQMGIIWNTIPGIPPDHPENLTRLNPLIAHSKYLEDRTKHWMELRDKHVNDARMITLTTPAQNEQKSILRHLALQCEEDAIQSKIQNAFINAVLRNPDFRGSLQNLGTLSKNTYSERILGNALNEPSANQLLTFNNHNLTPITFDDAKRMDVNELAQRIFAAM
jgi:hypothetical protein